MFASVVLIVKEASLRGYIYVFNLKKRDSEPRFGIVFSPPALQLAPQRSDPEFGVPRVGTVLFLLFCSQTQTILLAKFGLDAAEKEPRGY